MAELPEFICRFLRMICCNSTTQVEFAEKQDICMANVRQSCPGDGFLFAMAFDPFSMAPGHDHSKKNLAAPDFLQSSQCAYADYFALAASSFLSLITVLSPAFLDGEPCGLAQPEPSEVLLGTVW